MQPVMLRYLFPSITPICSSNNLNTTHRSPLVVKTDPTHFIVWETDRLFKAIFLPGDKGDRLLFHVRKYQMIKACSGYYVEIQGLTG
jgi:hypothetical protein